MHTAQLDREVDTNELTVNSERHLNCPHMLAMPPCSHPGGVRQVDQV